MQGLGNRLRNLQLDDEGQVDWTTFEHGVGVWALKGTRTLVTRLGPGEVELQDRDYTTNWFIKNNHSIEDAQLTNGIASFNLWAVFRGGNSTTRRLCITGTENQTRSNTLSITDGSPATDTLASRRRLIRRMSSNADPDTEDTHGSHGHSETVRFSRRCRPRAASSRDNVDAKHGTKNEQKEDAKDEQKEDDQKENNINDDAGNDATVPKNNEDTSEAQDNEAANDNVAADDNVAGDDNEDADDNEVADDNEAADD